MGIDFSGMLDDDDDVVLHPRDIFFTLNRSAAFSFPRDIQTEVMNSWFDKRDSPDNVIKLNVGSGKTAVGLLLLQSSLNEGKGPALYVTPDKQLAQQVIQEAKALGLEVTDDPRDADFYAGEKICVINVYKLFNGRSVFGVGANKIDVGTLIIDDAHACVSTISDQFRISLPNTHDAYQKIFAALDEDLKAYSLARYLNVEASDPQAYIEVPFWSWCSHQDEVLDALHKYRESDDLLFSYPLLSEILQHCRCVIGGQRLEIEPYFPATDIISSFRRAQRRIYMTATLSDDSVVVTHFGASPDALVQPIVPSSSQSVGERMILMPQELNTDLTTTEIKGLLAELAQTVNVVVLVPSGAAAQFWSDVANQTLIGDDVAPGVAKLRKGHIGLTVLVNRYDGIDLPGDACRVLAIVDLPEIRSYADLVESEVLSGSAINLRRQVERIEQGMGRGVRSNEDYCAVLLLGPKLTSRIRSQAGQNLLTPATHAQLGLSRKISKSLGKASLASIRDVVLQCLQRDPNWIKVSKKILVGLKADDQLKLDSGKLAIRKAFDLARANQYQESLKALDTAINDESTPQIKAWLLSRKAAFQHTLDAAGAQATLLAAYKLERGVTKPMQGATYKKLSASTGQQAANLISNHQARFLDATQMQLYVGGLCSDLQFSQGTSNKFEAAVNSLAWFLGVNGQRPEKHYNEGPDNLWALPNGKFLVIECKNEVTSDAGIAKKDAGQLGQSMAWFHARYPASEGVPIMIHPDTKLGQGATLVAGMRIIDSGQLDKLRINLRELAKQLVDPDVSTNATKVVQRLSQFQLNADAFIQAYTLLAKG